MAAIIKRLSNLEENVAEIQHKKSFIPVLIVREASEGVYTYSGNVITGEDELHEFVEMHGTRTIIIDNIPREKE